MMSRSTSSPCTACAIAKSTIKNQGLYTPLPTPSRPWESISMDYMSGLPSTKHGNDCVFVVVDRFSKMSIMMACKKNITAEATAKLFFERVWVHFGIPQSIISDRDSRFLSTFWSSLWSMLDTKIDPGGYWWPPTFSDWLKIVFWQFWQFTIFSRFNFRGHFEGLNEGFLRSRCSMIDEGMIEPPK
jgi:hypothetical protein